MRGRLARRRWTALKVGVGAVFFTGPYFAAAALPWGGRLWIDVVMLVLTVVNTAAAGTMLFYVNAVERSMGSSLITEAEVMTILAAKRRLDEL